MTTRSVDWEARASAASRPSAGTLFVRMMRRRRIIGLGALILLFIMAAAAAAPWLTPYNPLTLDVPARLQGPGRAHLFGTDDFGRDIFSRVLFGARLSLLVGTLVTVLATAGGVVIGLAAGANPRTDRVLMRIMDGLMAFPDIVLAIALMATLGPSVRNVIIALGFVYTPRVARVVRASVLVIINQEYVEAARAIGASRARIMTRHVLANSISPVIVQATFIAAFAMLGEAALSFLGVGVPPQVPTWGGIIASGQVYLRQAAWISVFPGAAIILCVLALNLLGDGLRDFLDPRLRYSS